MKIVILTKENDNTLIARLSNFGFDCLVFNNQKEFIEELKKKTTDIVMIYSDYIIDIDSFIHNLRKIDSNLYILLVDTLLLDNIRIDALLSGADDYISTKTTNQEKVHKILAIKNIINRYTSSYTQTLEFKNLKLDMYRHEIYINGERVIFSNKEFQILEFMLKRQNRLIPKGLLMEKFWNNQILNNSNIMNVYINSIRAKIKKHTKEEIISTIKGAGYILRSDN